MCGTTTQAYKFIQPTESALMGDGNTELLSRRVGGVRRALPPCSDSQPQKKFIFPPANHPSPFSQNHLVIQDPRATAGTRSNLPPMEL
jgi:hypothetical protein